MEKALHGLVFAVPHRLRRTAGSDPADGDFRFQRFRAVLHQCIRLGGYGGLECLHEIDQFMMLPMMSVGLASTTFTGQNVGASYIDRAKKGATTAFLLAELVTIVMMIPLLIFAPQMVYLFNQEAAVIRYGTLFLYLLSPFYISAASTRFIPTSCVAQETPEHR